MRHIIALGLVAIGAACSLPEYVPRKAQEDSQLEAQAASADDLFTVETTHAFELKLEPGGRKRLADKPRRPVRATFRYRDVVLENVGVKFKGHFTMQGWEAKPGFRILFDKFEPGQRFLGLRSLTLNNMHSDPSKLHEWLSYALFREMGLIAPRVGYAELVVDGTNYGVYANVESPDLRFLRAALGHTDVVMYEGGKGADLDKNLRRYERDLGEDRGRAQLARLAELAALEDDTVFFGQGSPLDLRKFVDFVATEALVGHFDGYQRAHNHRLLYDARADRWQLIPWGVDQTWHRELSPFSGRAMLTEKCVASPRCLEALQDAGYRALDALQRLDPAHKIDRVADMLKPALKRDKRKRHSARAIEAGVGAVWLFSTRRPESFADALDCLDYGLERDADRDGFGACAADCDDRDPAIHPNQQETCDGIDNDCNGAVDDHRFCPCEAQFVDGATFHFCNQELEWSAARDFCEVQGNTLAWFDSPEQSDSVHLRARAIARERWWIGLSDRSQEGDHRWVGGARPHFTAWANGEPDNRVSSYRCVGFRRRSPQWRKRHCGSESRFICREGGA